MKVALFYLENPNKPQTTQHNLESFAKYSQNEIFYFSYNNQDSLPCLHDFDCLVIHYYGQVYTDFSKKFLKYLRNFSGLKIIFAQDEYDRLTLNLKKYQNIQPDVLYSTCAISPEIKELLYPKSLLPYTEIINYLPGYVEPQDLADIQPIRHRTIDIFYRGNTLGIAYGSLGYEKIQIGSVVKSLALSKGLTVDIETDIQKQIYGSLYLEKMKDAKCTLITESGSSLIDSDAQYRTKILKEFQKNDHISFEEIKNKYREFYKNDGSYIINTIPPKAFEAIACKTALIGYEGHYSGILKPGTHYIPLKKDHSNLNEVLSLLHENNYLQDMVEKTFEDIVNSKKYSYETFIRAFDEKLASLQNKCMTQKYSPRRHFWKFFTQR